MREANQVLEEDVTKLRVENEQLRRKWVSSVSGSPAAILDTSSLRQSSSSDLATLREVLPIIRDLFEDFNQARHLEILRSRRKRFVVGNYSTTL